MIKVICDVNFYASPNFDKTNIFGIAKAGSVFTVVDFIKRDGTDMYRLKFWFYIKSM